MDKKVVNTVLLFILVQVFISSIFFIGGSVSSASFDIAEWPDSTRSGVSVFWVFISIVGAALCVAYYFETRRK